MGPFYSLASSYFFGIGLSSDERCHCGPVRHEGKVNLETLQLIHGAMEGPPGGPGPVFPAGDLPGLADDDARGLGRLFPRPGIGG